MEKNKNKNLSNCQAHHLQPCCPAQARFVSQLQKTQWMVWGRQRRCEDRRRRTEARRLLSSLHLPANLLEANDLVV